MRLAKEVERNIRRREEVGNTAGELAAPQQLNDVPTPPESDPRERRATKAVTAVASSASSQMHGRRVKNGCRGRRERQIQKFNSTEHQETNNDESVNGNG